MEGTGRYDNHRLIAGLEDLRLTVTYGRVARLFTRSLPALTSVRCIYAQDALYYDHPAVHAMA
jgi:hypothetical protein